MFQYGYCDLCINVDGVESKWVTSVCKKLRQFGYRTIALNITLSEDNLKVSKKKKGKQAEDIVPAPVVVEKTQDIEDLKILNRLTVNISETSQLYSLRRSPQFIKYNLFSVIPQNQNIFQQVCGMTDVDIISFAPESKLPYRLTRKLINMAVDKNVFFEIPYAPAILDDTCRKNIISTAHQYFTMGKSKNVFIASSSNYPFNSIRGPYDIIQLGLIFGLNDVQTKQTILNNCTELIQRAEARRRRKSCLSSFKYNEAVTTLPEEKNLDEQPAKKMKLDAINV